jgi:hypothetical protein
MDADGDYSTILYNIAVGRKARKGEAKEKQLALVLP